MMSESSKHFKAPWTIFWTALVVRVAYMTLAHTYRVRPAEDHFQFAWEMGRIARAWATGYGYADPFTGHTGPTAWLPPGYTALIALAFKLFGVYTAQAAWFLLAVNSIFSAATAMAVYEIGARCFNRKVAVWSGWLWALHPAAMQYAVRWIWEMTLTTMLLAWVIVLALRMRGIGETENVAERQTTARWAIFGLLWGLMMLSSPTPVLFLPVCGLWILWGAKDKVKALQKAVLAGVIFCAVLSPWVVRNYVVFHKFIPFRDNFGAENAMGNSEASIGFPWGTTVPLEDHEALRAYTQMGEVAWVDAQGAKASAWIYAHPARFIGLAVKRFYFYWVSVPHAFEKHHSLEYIREIDFCFLSLCGLFGLTLALRNGVPAAGLFAGAFLLLPLTYYFVTVQARFRHPLEPLICVLGVYLFQSAELGILARSKTPD